MIKHHTHYQEIHGYDKIVLMPRGEHKALHHRLRKQGKCNVPVEKLRLISIAAKDRGRDNSLSYQKHMKQYSYKNIQAIVFSESMCPNVLFGEQIRYNKITGSVYYIAAFRGMNGIKLPVHEVDN